MPRYACSGSRCFQRARPPTPTRHIGARRCSEGPSGRPGWECPAPIERVWCLFEIFQAIKLEVSIIIQLGSADAVAFRAALNKAGGISRLQRAIEAIDVRFADASVESDRKLILNNIEESAGIDELNRLIRARLLIEFKRISAQSLA